MQFIILEKKKIIIFWSPKCGCSSLKVILCNYLNIDFSKNKHVHKNKTLKKMIDKLPKNINYYKDYDILWLIRNPYERLVSGFLNKYINTQYKIPKNCNNFKDFCKILYNNSKKINKHHFENQTVHNNAWNFLNKLDKSKIKYIETSQVNEISKILNININFVHKNNSKQQNKTITNSKINELWLKTFKEVKTLKKQKKINYSDFYNDELKKLVHKIYKNNFNYFNKNFNLHYDI